MPSNSLASSKSIVAFAILATVSAYLVRRLLGHDSAVLVILIILVVVLVVLVPSPSSSPSSPHHPPLILILILLVMLAGLHGSDRLLHLCLHLSNPCIDQWQRLPDNLVLGVVGEY